MPQVIFSHKKIREKEYLNDLLEEKAWFESENFDAFFPKNKDSINKEMKVGSDLLNKKMVWLRNEWKKIEKEYFAAVKKLRGKKLSPIYDCHVSCFGPEGKYTRPNIIFVRLRGKLDKQRVIETVGHELLHLLFADLFESRKLNYAEREGMIDAIILQSDLINIFRRYKKQSIGRVHKKLLEDILQKL